MIWALSLAALVAGGVASIRWLRVAQREHYLPGVTRFAFTWWTIDGRNVALWAVGVAGLLVAAMQPWAAFVAVVVGAVAPLGLSVRGRSSPLAWTSRLKRLAAVTGGLSIVWTVVAVGIRNAPVAAALPLALPLLVDLALVVVRPYEHRQGERWVRAASESLQRIDPTVVAITGSYGKTTTKHLVAHLLSPVRSVVASPASFNNRMGLARAINEHLASGTEVFVAEMGTYGPGEIAELCRWIPPDVAVITALGPVHLERMGSVENIARAKREILEHAPTAILSVDHPLLAEIVREESGRRRVLTVSGNDRSADVCADREGNVWVAGNPVGDFAPDAAHPVNVAAAVAVCVALGVELGEVVDRLASLPAVPHRRTVGRSDRGFEIVDDTFNSNPAGASAALDLLLRLGEPGGRKVVVTPGMVELGTQQEEANRRFGEEAARRGVTDFVIVNRTNRQALESGVRGGGAANVILCATRDDAVRWVREHLGAGDAVLYENDLPDHYP
ncbi:MAG: Mur ligase family protein [Acidimicrobiia bacterium]